ncbi:hypothetical protein GUJ93_ZPchr0015g6772 [Zizania palustris]|uniref:Uncharacterized protein n=1 Tax=Zizania palustris TaxID=103762 RepID=A0A8J5TB00_ZIZPA|nr:hypothetical protein GUJ93_ZPchr0015g6868 [Zizania palustris]KAG8083234.1 hypothetical protein GUJ93_ZPchr0015g6772 [Zizania palustris]
MDTGFYKRGGRGAAKHKTAAMPFYTRSPAVAPAAPSAGGKAKVLAATAPWPAPSPPPLPPSSVVAVEIVISGMYSSGGGDSDVDRRAAMYISRVQERLRRERAMGEWAMM